MIRFLKLSLTPCSKDCPILVNLTEIVDMCVWRSGPTAGTAITTTATDDPNIRVAESLEDILRAMRAQVPPDSANGIDVIDVDYWNKYLSK